MKTTQIEPHRSSLGMDANIAAVIIWVAMAGIAWIPFLGWVSWGVPILFFVLEKESKFIKYQAIMALIVGVVRAGISIVLQILVWILTPRIKEPKNIWEALEAIDNYVNKSWGIWTFFSVLSVIIAIAITAVIVYFIVMAYGYKQVEVPGVGKITDKASEQIDKINTNSNTNTNANQASQTQTPANSENTENAAKPEEKTEGSENKND